MSAKIRKKSIIDYFFAKTFGVFNENGYLCTKFVNYFTS